MNMTIRNGSVYGATARFDTGRPMTEDELRKFAPSVFAKTAHESRSDRFAPIPTIDVLRGLKNEGFEVVGATQSVTRVEGKKDFTKHLLRLRCFDDSAKQYAVGDTVAEMLLKNANDGTCRYNLLAALFRIQCLNSMVTQIGELSTVTVGHIGNVKDKVIEGTFEVIADAKRALAAPATWSDVHLDRDERMLLAETAHKIRFADTEGEIATPIKADQLLTVKRVEDNKTDLWTTFNVVQENVIRGGLRGVRIDTETNRRRNMSTRAVKGIDQSVKLNKALWEMAQKFAELKGVKIAA